MDDGLLGGWFTARLGPVVEMLNLTSAQSHTRIIRVQYGTLIPVAQISSFLPHGTMIQGQSLDWLHLGDTVSYVPKVTTPSY